MELPRQALLACGEAKAAAAGTARALPGGERGGGTREGGLPKGVEALVAHGVGGYASEEMSSSKQCS
jgi:hypothetical protein